MLLTLPSFHLSPDANRILRGHIFFCGIQSGYELFAVKLAVYTKVCPLCWLGFRLLLMICCKPDIW